MSPSQPVSAAAQAIAENGLVLLEGLSGIAATLTIEAAEATARALLEAAAEARRQAGAAADPG